MDIREAANKLSISPDTIRQWERLGMIPPIHRSDKGEREITPTILKWLQYAKILNKMGVSKDFQIEYVKLVELGKQATPARQAFLQEQLANLNNDHQCLLTAIQQMESLVEDKQAN